MARNPTNISLETLKRELAANRARWRAAETPVSKLPPEERARLLGAIPSPEAEVLMAAARAMPPELQAAPGFAPAIDWRNYNGNHVSAVKSQGGCGSCVSFACVGVLESMGHIQLANWFDLSEADSHFCSSHGANCGGWWPDQCLGQAKSRGICDEAGFPYASAFPNNDIWNPSPTCKTPADRPNRITKIANIHALTTPTAAKNHLTNIGPIAGCLDVYTDFFNYSGGVYHHVSGVLEGGHCVLVIGYSEAEQCWIIKNSWDTTWGIGGFGKISYADMKFNGNFYPMYGATGIAPPSSGFRSLGGVLTTEPVASNNKDGRIEVFARGTDNALWHIWQTAPNNGWGGWASLGGVITSVPAVINNADGRLEAFARGSDGALWHIWQTAPNNGWSAWASLGGVITSDPAAVRNADGRIEVFARGTDGRLWHIWQQGPQFGWSNWHSLGVQFVGHPVASNNKDGRIEVFMRASNGALLHIWQTSPNGNWSGWASRGGTLTSDLAVGQNKDGRLEVFARGADNALWHIWQTAPNGNWSGWASLGGGLVGDTAVTNNKDGRMEIFVRGTNLGLFHRWQTQPNNGWN
jgi:C1A family cysteine protease/acylphosphatase